MIWKLREKDIIAKIKLDSPEQAAEVQEELVYFEYLKLLKKIKRYPKRCR